MKKIDYDKLIGIYAKKYRQEILELTQDEISAKIGVTKQTISNFESGRFHSSKVFDGYCNLGMPYPFLYGNTDASFTMDGVMKYLADKEV